MIYKCFNVRKEAPGKKNTIIQTAIAVKIPVISMKKAFYTN